MQRASRLLPDCHALHDACLKHVCGVQPQVMAYGASGTGKTGVLGMRRVFAGGVFSAAVQAMWRELAAVQAHSRISVEVQF